MGKQRLSTNLAYTPKFNLNYGIKIETMRASYLFAIVFLSRALLVVGQIHPDKNIDSLYNLAERYDRNNLDSCYIIGSELLAYAEKRNDMDGKALGYLCLSMYYDHVGNYAEATEYAFKAKRLYDDGLTHNPTIATKILLQIGILYMLIDQPALSIEYYEEALQHARHHEVDPQDKLFLEVQMARSKFDLQIKDSLEAIINKVIDLKPTDDNTNFLTARNLLLSKVAIAQGNQAKAMEYFQEIKSFCTTYNNQFFLAASLGALGSFYLNRNQIDSAIHYANQSIQISQQYNFNRHILSASELLIKIYNLLHQKDSVLKYLELKLKANEVMYGKAQLSQLLSLANQQKLIKKDMELLNQKNKSNLKLLLLGSLGILSVLGLFFLSYRNKQKSKLNDVLHHQKQNIESKNQELEQTLSQLKSTQAQLIQSEKMASLGELTAGIAHEIQNPLNFVNNFSALNTELADELELELTNGNFTDANELAKNIKKNAEKIHHHGQRASSIVKGMLEHSRTSSGEKVLTDINQLCDEYTRLAYHGLRAKNKNFNSEYTIDLDPQMPKLHVVSQDIARVILNIVTNAFQACNEKALSLEMETTEQSYKPLVKVATNYLAESRICQITITDNGPGIPEDNKDKIFQPFFTSKPTGQGTGLGLSLSYDIVKAHGGEIKVDSRIYEGTYFKICIRVSDC
jgi:two-component system, NtrC family, sensor kinase